MAAVNSPRRLVKEPKPVVLAKQVVAEAGKEVSADALKETLTTKQYNNLCNVFRQSMSPQTKNDYKKLKTDDERRQWTAAFVLDPALVAAEGFNRTSVFKSETNMKDEMWLSLDQLQGPYSFSTRKTMLWRLSRQENWRKGHTSFQHWHREGSNSTSFLFRCFAESMGTRRKIARVVLLS